MSTSTNMHLTPPPPPSLLLSFHNPQLSSPPLSISAFLSLRCFSNPSLSFLSAYLILRCTSPILSFLSSPLFLYYVVSRIHSFHSSPPFLYYVASPILSLLSSTLFHILSYFHDPSPAFTSGRHILHPIRLHSILIILHSHFSL